MSRTDKPRLSANFESALVFATQLHRLQVRKVSEVPYVAHLLAVTALVLEHGGDEDTAIAALLHDAPEDQGGLATLERIETLFGARVAAIVKGCSDTLDTPKPPWRPRKEAHVEALRRAGPEVRLVYSADKIHNARSIRDDHARVGSAVWERFHAGPRDIAWYYGAIAEALRDAGGSTLQPELEHVVAELVSLAGADAGRT